MATYKILIMGASYGSLLASKLLFGGHSVKLVCLPAEADLINAEGFRVRMPVKGRKDGIEIDSRKLPGKVSAAGPGQALRRLRPNGPVVVLAARAAVVAAVTMGLAGVASVAAAVGLYLWAPAYAGYHVAWPLAVYLPAVLLAASVAVVSAARGIRAADPPAVA